MYQQVRNAERNGIWRLWGGAPSARCVRGSAVHSRRPPHRIGCTEEDLRKTVFGLEHIGALDEPAFDRTNGTGYVAACDGDYADAIAKHHKTHLLIVETTGAHSAPLMALFYCAGSRRNDQGQRRARPHRLR